MSPHLKSSPDQPRYLLCYFGMINALNRYDSEYTNTKSTVHHIRTGIGSQTQVLNVESEMSWRPSRGSGSSDVFGLPLIYHLLSDHEKPSVHRQRRNAVVTFTQFQTLITFQILYLYAGSSFRGREVFKITASVRSPLHQ